MSFFKYSLTLLLLLFLSLPNTTFAQSEIANEKEQNLFKLMKMCHFLKNVHGPIYFDQHEYNYERTGDGKLKITAKTNAGIKNAMLGDRYMSYIVDVDEHSSSISANYECGRKWFIRVDKWDGNRPLKTGSSGFVSGTVLYDGSGNLKCIDGGLATTGSGKKKRWLGNLFCVDYDAQGKFQKGAKLQQRYKGKERKNLKKERLFNEYVFDVSHNENELVLNVERFTYKEGEELNTENKTYTITSDGSSTIEDLVWGYPSRKDNNTGRNVKKHRYDNNMRLIEMLDISKGQGTTRKEDYQYDNMNNVIKKRTQLFNASNEIIEEKIVENEYNDLGLAIASKSIENKDGALKQTIETSRRFEAKQDGLLMSKCSHKALVNSKFYNGQGELVRENREDGKMRYVKNGVWTEWKFAGM